MDMANTPPSGMASSWSRRAAVCGPAFQACSTLSWGARLVETRDVVQEIDAGRDDQAVVGQLGAAGQLHRALGRVDAVHPVTHQAHAVALAQVVVRRGDVGHGLVAAHHQVGDRARDEHGAGLDQRHVDLVIGEHAHVFGGGGAGIAATDHHHLGAVAAGAGATAQQTQAGHGRACAQRLYELTTFHGGAPQGFLCGEVGRDLGQLLVGVALGQLVHDGRGAFALFVGQQLLEHVVLVLAGQIEATLLRAAVGAVAVGAGCSPYLDLIDLGMGAQRGGQQGTCGQPFHRDVHRGLQRLDGKGPAKNVAEASPGPTPRLGIRYQGYYPFKY